MFNNFMGFLQVLMLLRLRSIVQESYNSAKPQIIPSWPSVTLDIKNLNIRKYGEPYAII